MAEDTQIVIAEHHPLSGMMLGAVAFALCTAIDTVFKLMAGHHPSYQILVVNGLIALCPILLWTAVTGGLRRLHTSRLLLHLLRGGISTSSAYLAIYAYSHLHLTDFYAIIFAGPLMVATLSSVFLREAMGLHRVLAIIVGFSGVIVAFDPFQNVSAQGGVADPDILLARFSALGAVACYAVSVVLIRHMRSRETNMTFSFYGYLASISVGLCILLIRHDPDLPMLTGHDWRYLVTAGLMSGFSSIALMTAYHRTPAVLVAPFQYTQMIWAAVSGYVLWAHIPSLKLIVGAAIVAASGFYIIYSEMRPKQPCAAQSRH